MTGRTLILLVLPLAAFADDPFACVDPDVLDAFVGGPYGPARYSTDLPAEADDLPLPADFELIGSRTAGSNTTVAYKSAAETGAALASSIAALEAGGWKDASGALRLFRGFHGGSAPRRVHLCHTSEAQSLEITARERSADTLLLISLTRLDDWRHCRASAGYSLRPALREYLPDLEIPDDARLRSNESGGGGDEYSTSAVVSTGLDRTALLEHFNEQIRTQGWVADSEWAGGTTVGTVWTRRGSNGQLLVGTMRVAEAAEGIFNARFTVISVAPEDHADGSFSESASVG